MINPAPVPGPPATWNQSRTKYFLSSLNSSKTALGNILPNWTSIHQFSDVTVVTQRLTEFINFIDFDSSLIKT